MLMRSYNGQTVAGGPGSLCVRLYTLVRTIESRAELEIGRADCVRLVASLTLPDYGRVARRPGTICSHKAHCVRGPGRC
jgi:hypothetical protein